MWSSYAACFPVVERSVEQSHPRLRTGCRCANVGPRMLGLFGVTFAASITCGVAPLDLEWTAPPECPGVEVVRAHLDDYLGEDARPTRHRARGRITAESDGWRLELEIDGEHREMRSRRCETLAEAAAVVLSLAMDPTDADEPAPPPPVAAPRSAPPAALAPIAVRRPSRLRAAIRVDTGVLYGIGPVSSDVALAIAMLWPHARFELRGLYGPATNARRSGTVQTQGYGGPRGCWVPRVSRFELPLCVGGHVAVQRIDALPAMQNDARHDVRPGLDAAVALVWPLRRRIALWVGIEGLFPFGRPRITLPTGLPYRMGVASVRAALGVELRIP
jgi:hypothetical protein